MWQTVSDLVVDSMDRATGVIETVLPMDRQLKLTLSITVALFCMAVFLVGFILWADLSYS